MTPSQIQKLSDSIASMLLSYACHGESTDSLSGMGEITLRDGLVVAAAATGSRLKKAWILEREILPPGWTDSAIDLVVSRLKTYKKKSSKVIIGVTELKWWRQTDAANSSNRRRDLVKDFLRAAAIYPDVESFSFVALLATTDSWNATVNTNKSDKDVMDLVMASGVSKWNITTLKSSKSIANAVKILSGRAPIVNTLHTELLSEASIVTAAGTTCFARVWAVRKPQNSALISPKQVDSMFPKKKAASQDAGL